MANTDIRQTTTSELASNQSDFSVSSKQTDSPSDYGESYWDSPYWTKWLGYYTKIPELKQAINALATWTAGRGWTTDPRTQVILDHITGWGEDTFQSIMENMIIVKKINGDSFAEIIRDEKSGTLLNLKPLNPNRVRVVVKPNGRIDRYEQLAKGSKTGNKKLKVTDILHLSNDRVADETHGVSVVEACEQVILARNEAMTDWQKVLHRNINPLKIFELDTDEPTKISNFKTQYHTMTKDYEALFVPMGNAKVTIPNVPLQSPLEWIRYLENFFYQAVGVPKIILGGSDQISEGSNKMSSYNFEQVYMREQRLLEDDLWNQLQIRVKFERPNSLVDNMQGNEAKNTSQTGFQPKDFSLAGGRE